MTSQDKIREKRPDCGECQLCSKTRCELCKKGNMVFCDRELGPFITHGEYLAWKKKKEKIHLNRVSHKCECTDKDD